MWCRRMRNYNEVTRTERPAGRGNSAPPRRRRLLIFAVVAVFVIVVALDQLTKNWAVAHLEHQPPIPIIDGWVSLLFFRNGGAAFGMGAGATWLFAVVATIVVVVIIVTARKLGSLGWAISLGLLVAGAGGNLSDRLFRQPGFGEGKVVDFINLHFFICNVADIAITAGAVMFIVLSFIGIGLDGTRSNTRGQSPSDSPDSPRDGGAGSVNDA